jgi:hypothetical protein
MSSLKSYFRKINPLKKPHKYETVADLIRERPTPEAIIRTDPNDVGLHIMEEMGGVTLNEQQKKALRILLAIKREEKETGKIDLKARERVITQFLGFQPQVDALINKVTGEIVQETNKALEQQIEQKDLENRLRALRDEPIVPYTEEEKLYKRQLELRKGGKRTRKHKKKSSRKHKRSSRKNKKRGTRKNKKRKY